MKSTPLPPAYSPPLQNSPSPPYPHAHSSSRTRARPRASADTGRAGGRTSRGCRGDRPLLMSEEELVTSFHEPQPEPEPEPEPAPEPAPEPEHSLLGPLLQKWTAIKRRGWASTAVISRTLVWHQAGCVECSLGCCLGFERSVTLFRNSVTDRDTSTPVVCPGRAIGASQHFSINK
eukprot:COSAG01_NODE_2755_length_7137_cov_3.530548_3_plen_176_part_00